MRKKERLFALYVQDKSKSFLIKREKFCIMIDCRIIVRLGDYMDVHVGDTLIMKKPHPCGETSFTVKRVGMDFRIKCNGCGHEVMAPRGKIEKNIKKILRDGQPVEKN